MNKMPRTLLTAVSVLTLSLFVFGCTNRSMDYQGHSKPMMEKEGMVDDMSSGMMKESSMPPEAAPEKKSMDTGGY